MDLDQKLAAIYAQIPDVKCKGKCQQCCGPIGMSHAEFERIRERVGERLRAFGFGSLGVGVCSKSLTCEFLTEKGRCGIYDLRPVICRIWGATKEMRCPHGCRPKKWLTKPECHRLLSDAEAVLNPI